VRRLPVPTAFLANLPLFRLIDEGGDWDRRNRLKVYTGLHFLSIRQFKRGGELLLDALSTFTATELLSYNEFVGLTVIANTLGLKRVDLKKKVRTFSIFCPACPSLTRTFAAHQRPRSESSSPRNTSTRRPSQKLYECHYDKFFVALGPFSPHSQPPPTYTPPLLATLEQTHLIPSRLLSPHAHSRVHATTRELSKSDARQPVFSVWGRQELGRRVSVFS
jgi:26S proteasome regulatory subunit N7